MGVSVNVGKDKKQTVILVADSHKQSLNIIAIMLHKLGYQAVLEASDTDSADRAMKKATLDNSGMAGLLGGAAPKIKCDIGLVILDCDLQPGSSMQFLRKLRRSYSKSALPVLAIAMKGQEDCLVDALGEEANDTLLKPFSQNVLKAKIAALFDEQANRPKVAAFSFAGTTPAVTSTPRKTEKASASALTSAPKKKEKAPPPVAPQAVKVNGPAKTPAKLAGGSGASFYGMGQGTVTYSTEGEPTAELVNGKIDGHYHEQVQVIGGGVNCYWAMQIGDEERVRLEYLSAKGKKTGMEAKTIPLEQFMYTFHLCDENTCPIMERQKEENAS
ncbi:hypothetical protein MNBD_NITROSPINAE01-869 [hydrothermal vent metagenome]|uniref:Response regulatory domain-containing protein n=1 Tax=hydrothermal vent metagenome TaxID=652676 RepID=A0A3B1CE98_9ZZZZ